MDRKEEKIKDLTNWLLQENSDCSICKSVSVERTHYGGRGLFSNDKIKPKQRLIKISHPYLLNFTNILAHITFWGENEVYNKMKLPEFPKKKDRVTDLYAQMDLRALLKLTSFQIVCMYICLELQRGENSWWVPFWNSLPPVSDFESSPLTWKLSGKPTTSLPRSTQRHCDKMYNRFMADLTTVTFFIKSFNNNVVITQEEFHWAWFCVNSRCLYMVIPESHTKADNFTMAPFVDLINHSPNEQCILKIDHSGFHVLTSTDYQSNQEVYLSYGPHSNEFLLCEYGFMLPENPWNDVDLTDQILSVLDSSQKDFLESKGYLGDYTMNHNDVSFRIEVALAVSLEEDGNLNENRRLKALINGMSDGKYYKRKSDEILMSILDNLRDEYENKLNGDEVVDALYKQQLIIISHQLEKLQQDS